ncbi:pirin family protein [Pedobacter sp. KBW06]|uniref:pirin family protein n=1 Tax=Pedobacter sp. KBW06 TaxID=2153359 RepID=UPI000F590050|nr:pirin family protein [Pedobacter sp. KBW06]RQO65370.1 pirin family protein [Pedobacter sp. KBW06]
MKSYTTRLHRGLNSRVDDFLVNRLLPSGAIRSVGAIVLLDHTYPVNLQQENFTRPYGQHAHPHRGIATLSYVLSGSLSHYDSMGNHGFVNKGGIQWMKAGNGIIHEEKPFLAERDGPTFHSLQFWINLPGDRKKDDPEYISLQTRDIPEAALPKHSGTIRILVGKFGIWASAIPTFNDEFIYHIRLNPNSTFPFSPPNGHEVAAFVPVTEIAINSRVIGNSKLLLIGEDIGEIVFYNDQIKVADVLVFGGSPYTEPIFAEGPFVMNSALEIASAYKDFFEGLYGTIPY